MRLLNPKHLWQATNSRLRGGRRQTIELPLFSAPKTDFSLFFDASIIGCSKNASAPGTHCMLNVEPLQNDGKRLGAIQVQRFFLNGEDTRIVLPISVPAETCRIRTSISRRFMKRGKLQVSNIGAIAQDGIYSFDGHDLHHVSNRIERVWSQSGRDCVIDTNIGRFSAEMPLGWRLDKVHPAALKMAEFFLFAQVEHLLFERPLYEDAEEIGSRRATGPNTLLAFSAGEDSTAAATLLPDETKKYFCKRSYETYRSAGGYVINLAPIDAIERALHAVPNTLAIPNDFELIGLRAGFRHGYRHGYGYAAIGCLLADHFDAGVLALGSVMEQVFMGSGNNYKDIVVQKNSKVTRHKRLLEQAGLFLSMPTGGCSEVATNKIVKEGRYAGLAVPCPKSEASGVACGRCFKCFRKGRFDGKSDAVPDPDPGVLQTLDKYPLKSATSVVYAAQKSDYCHPAINRYKGYDLSFLERHHGYAIDYLVPRHLRDYVRRSLIEHGVAPMSDDDERALRSIGKVFWPERFNAKVAGLEESSAEDIDVSK